MLNPPLTKQLMKGYEGNKNNTQQFFNVVSIILLHSFMIISCLCCLFFDNYTVTNDENKASRNKTNSGAI